MPIVGDIGNGLDSVLGAGDEASTTHWSGDPRGENWDKYSVTNGPHGTSSFGPEWTKNPGTSYSQVRTDDPYTIDTNGSTGADDYGNRIGGMGDIRNYQYGRSATGADDAVNMALVTGDQAMQHAYNTSDADRAQALAAQQRGALQGNWGNQNAAIGGAGSYAGQLSSLEAQQGPSGAQAQLNAGTNAAMAQQLAMARSGRGLGGNAAAMGLAQGNMAGISANQANQAAMLAAQENQAWRGRQATNLGNAAGIQLGMGTQYGQQGTADLGAAVAGRAQNDTAALGWAGQGDQAFNNGVAANFNGQSLGNQIRGAEMQGGQTAEDNFLRQWSAKNNYTLAQQQRQDQQDAAMLQFAATTGATALGAF